MCAHLHVVLVRMAVLARKHMVTGAQLATLCTHAFLTATTFRLPPGWSLCSPSKITSISQVLLAVIQFYPALRILTTSEHALSGQCLAPSRLFPRSGL